MKAPANSAPRRELELIEEGPSSAYLLKIVRMGEVEQFDGEVKDKLMLVFELPEEMMEVNGEEKPRVMSTDVTFSGNPKAKLYQIAEAIDSSSVDDSGIDLSKLLGKPLTVNIKHREKGGKTYANISSFASIKSKVAAKLPEMYNESVMVDLTDADADRADVEKVYPWILKKVVKSDILDMIKEVISLKEAERQAKRDEKEEKKPAKKSSKSDAPFDTDEDDDLYDDIDD